MKKIDIDTLEILTKEELVQLVMGMQNMLQELQEDKQADIETVQHLLIGSVHGKIEHHNDMWDLANIYSRQHRRACEHDKLGNVIEVWYDDDKNLCIKYANGDYYHYKCDKSTKYELEWW